MLEGMFLTLGSFVFYHFLSKGHNKQEGFHREAFKYFSWGTSAATPSFTGGILPTLGDRPPQNMAHDPEDSKKAHGGKNKSVSQTLPQNTLHASRINHCWILCINAHLFLQYAFLPPLKQKKTVLQSNG